MSALILGSCGQIGSALVDYLSKEQTVIPYDIVRNPSEDLRDVNSNLVDIVAESDFVYFLAFDVGGSRYLQKYQDTYGFIKNNMAIMQNTFAALEKTKTPFLFASSQMSGMAEASTYGTLKLIGEKYTRALNGIVVKLWNVYGIEHDKEKSHVITDFIDKACEQGRIDMLTNGTEERQFLYSDDCCECLKIISERYSEIDPSTPLHITNFEWTSILKIAEIVSTLFPGTKVAPAVTSDVVQHGVKNEPDRQILALWQPKTPIEEGIRLVAESMSAS